MRSDGGQQLVTGGRGWLGARFVVVASGALLAGLMLLVLVATGRWLRRGTGEPTPDQIDAAISSFEPRRVPLTLDTMRRLDLSAEEARRVTAALERLYPRKMPFSASHQLHALLLWGDTESVEPGDWSPAETLDAVFKPDERVNADSARPYYRVTRHGLRLAGSIPEIRSFGDPHPCLTLSVLAQLGMKSTTPIVWRGEQHTVADMVRATIAEFRWRRHLEWTAVAFALYFPPTRGWTNKYGEPFDFNGLCRSLCGAPVGESHCFGMHLFQALAIICRADDMEPLLDDSARQAAYDTFSHLLEQLEREQRPNGNWDIGYYGTDDWADQVSSMSPDVVITGHALELLALLPEDLPVDRAMVRRACHFVVERTLAESEAGIARQYPAFSHCGLAVKRWSPSAWAQARRSVEAHREAGEVDEQ